MDYHMPELEKLTVYLEAEAAGRPFDRDGALRLARALAQSQPEIRASLNRIVERLTH